MLTGGAGSKSPRPELRYMGKRSGGARPHAPADAWLACLLRNALHQERDAHEGAPLVEVLATQAGGYDVDRLDVAQRLARVLERRLDCSVRALGRAAHNLDDLRDRHVLLPFGRGCAQPIPPCSVAVDGGLER